MIGALEGDIREKFRRSGYTLTSQRRAVLDALEESGGHPSTEDVYLIVKQKNPRVALGTVYQALSVLGMSPAQPSGAPLGPQVGQPVRVLLASSGAAPAVPSTMAAAALPARRAAAAAPGRLPAVAAVALQSGAHVVAPGETLTAIASRESVTVRDLAGWNGLTDVDLIRAGQRLRLSAPGVAAKHVVRPGETLSHVALAWDTSVEAVRRANQLTDADRVEAGRTLLRPGQ